MVQTTPTISMSEELLEQVDDYRHATISRSQWIREAIRMRLESEGVEPVAEDDG